VHNGEDVLVTSSAALGSVDGARDLDLDVCYSSGVTVVPIPNSGVDNLTAASGQQQLFTLSAVAEGLSGTYSVGLCAQSSDATSWNLQCGGQTTVQVLKAD
jgi:hypothetical protein